VNENEGSRPAKCSKSIENTTNFDAMHKQVHNIDWNGRGPIKKLGEKISTFEARKQKQNLYA
jgi:hypothetical protein